MLSVHNWMKVMIFNGLYKLQFLLNQLCKTFLFTERERSLIFSSLKKSCLLKSVLLVNFLIRWYSYILNLLNISMMLNKSIIQRYWFQSPLFDFLFRPGLFYRVCFSFFYVDFMLVVVQLWFFVFSVMNLLNMVIFFPFFVVLK